MPNWKKLITSGSNAALNTLNVTTSVTASSALIADLTYPVTDGVNGQVIGTDGSGNLSFVAGGGAKGQKGEIGLKGQKGQLGAQGATGTQGTDGT